MERFNFEQFNQLLENKKTDIVIDQRGKNYVLMVAQNEISIANIDFNAFMPEDVVHCIENVEQAITDEDTDGGISLDPQHPYSRMWILGHKIAKFEEMPKKRPKSPYLFI